MITDGRTIDSEIELKSNETILCDTDKFRHLYHISERTCKYENSSNSINDSERQRGSDSFKLKKILKIVKKNSLFITIGSIFFSFLSIIGMLHHHFTSHIIIFLLLHTNILLRKIKSLQLSHLLFWSNKKLKMHLFFWLIKSRKEFKF